jgi:hypothetical protein
VLDVRVDASNLPRRYNQVVYTQCINFPQKLIFFLLASFNVRRGRGPGGREGGREGESPRT